MTSESDRTDDDDAEQEVPSTASSGLLHVLVGLALSAGVGWCLASGPAAVRRPLLTPVVVGVAFGIALTRCFPAERRSARTINAALVLLLPPVTLALMHQQVFEQLEAAASKYRFDHPEAAQALAMYEQLADPTESEALTRELRLAVEPRFADYLAQRAAPLIGEQSSTIATAFAIVEGVAAALSSLYSHRQLAHRPIPHV